MLFCLKVIDPYLASTRSECMVQTKMKKLTVGKKSAVGFECLKTGSAGKHRGLWVWQ